jgi:hypothetical protein
MSGIWTFRRDKKEKMAAKQFENLKRNITDVRRLLEIHEIIAGKTAGYKHNVEVINKSGVVLLVASWEAFIEDLALTAFEAMLSKAKKVATFPNKVLTLASRDLKQSHDETQVWKLADSGWKTILRQHKDKIIEKHIGDFNTPRARQIDSLFQCLLGLNNLSSQWHWNRMSAVSAVKKLDSLVTLRGDIAHRVAASEKVYKGDVYGFIDFVHRLAVISSNRVRSFVYTRTKYEAWDPYYFGRTR